VDTTGSLLVTSRVSGETVRTFGQSGRVRSALFLKQCIHSRLFLHHNSEMFCLLLYFQRTLSETRHLLFLVVISLLTSPGHVQLDQQTFSCSSFVGLSLSKRSGAILKNTLESLSHFYHPLALLLAIARRRSASDDFCLRTFCASRGRIRGRLVSSGRKVL